MKKLLALLLLSPITFADVLEGESWDDFINRLGDSLTQIECQSSGEYYSWMSEADETRNVEYTDYYFFNDDYLFSRIELAGFETANLKYKELTASNIYSDFDLTFNEDFISGVRSATQEGLDAVSDAETTYKKFDSEFYINRSTGAYKYSSLRTFDVNLGEVNQRITLKGNCSVITNKKKF